MKIKGKHFLSNQEFFDAAWNWLVVENRPKCVNENGSCSYRSNNQTCVIGAFIPDDLYKSDLEGKTVLKLMTIQVESCKPIQVWFENVEIDLMNHLQAVHDCFYDGFSNNKTISENDRRKTRIESLERIAKKFNLTIPKENNV